MLRQDDRAQVIQIAAIVLFGFVVVTFSLYQANVVPADVADTEYEHSQRVQSQLLDVRTSLHTTADTGSSYPVTVSLGTSYQARLIAVNPAPATGSLTSEPMANVSLSNVDTPASGGLQQLLQGGIEYRTRNVTYRPGYNRYASGPTTRYESSVLFSEFDSGQAIARSEQTLVNGNRLSLVLVHGNLSAGTAGTETVDPTPLSAPATTVPVTGNGGGPLTLSVPSSMPNASWQPLLNPELQANGGNLQAYRCTGADDEPCGTLTLELDPDVEYSLEVAAVGVGAVDQSISKPTYIVATHGNESVVPEGSRQQVVVQVRDRFNNPVSGVQVNATTDGNRSDDSITANAVTDADGRATLVYEAPDNVDTDEEVTAEVAFGGSGSTLPVDPSGMLFDSPKDVKVTFTVVNTDNGPGNAPTVEKFAATNVSNDTHVRFDVDWTVSDQDRDLQEVNVTLENSSGDVVDFNTTQVSGNRASQGKNNEESPDVLVADTNGGTYTVRITVTDAAGNSASEAQTFTVATGGGDGGGDGSGGNGGGRFTVTDSTVVGQNDAGVEFGLRNDGTDTVTLQSVRIVNFTSSQNINNVAENDTSAAAPQTVEVYVSGTTDGWAEAGDTGDANYGVGKNNAETIDFSTDGQEPTLDAGTTGTMTFYAFRGKKGSPIDMNGKNGGKNRTFYLEVTYVDSSGTTRTDTVSVTT